MVDSSAPVITTNTGISIGEGDGDTTISSSELAANDAVSSAAQITYNLVAAPTNGSLFNNGTLLSDVDSFTQGDLDSNLITYDHDGGESTSDSFSFVIVDNLGNSDNNGGANFEFAITIGAVNDAPLALDDSESTDEDNAVQIDVLANDSDSDDAINAASVSIQSAPSLGATSINTGTGVITYTPNADANGADSFTYTVEDIAGDVSNSATVSITINSVNDAPAAVNDLANTNEDTAITIDVAANDTDVDAADSVDTSTLVVSLQPEDGTAVIVAGEITYTPDANFNGSDSFAYTIEDQNGARSNVATVIVNVSSENDLPIAVDDSAAVDEDTSADISVLANDSDIDGELDETSIQILSSPANGEVFADIAGVITYTPDENFNGVDSFTYVVQDDESGTSNEATVSLTINSVNDVPVAEDDTAVLLEEVAHMINVLGNDSDVDGTINAATLAVLDQPSSGTVDINTETGTATYTPNENFNGDDSFTYSVQDNEGGISNTATVSLTVESVNDLPLANDDAFNIVAGTPTTINLLDNDSDVDGTLDAASIILVTTPTQGVVSNNNDGTVTYTPNSGINVFTGDSFSYTVNDDEAGVSNVSTVTISFIPGSTFSLSGSPDTQVLELVSYTFVPVLSGEDPLFPVTFGITSLPSWASFNAATGEVSGTPASEDIGLYSGIVIIASDGVTEIALAEFSIDVIAQVDTDGDTITDYQEGLDGTDPNDPLDYTDLIPPELQAPEAIILDAVALFTEVSERELLSLSSDASEEEVQAAREALVTDNVDGDGCCQPAAVDLIESRFLMAPGENRVSWQAVDRRGNTALVEQSVFIRPLVSLSKDDVAVEGQTIAFSVVLNGQAAQYPLSVPFVIDSASTVTSEDHSLVDGVATFENGEFVQDVIIDVTEDTIAEGEEVLIVRLDDRTTEEEDLFNRFDADIYDINSGSKTEYRLTLVESNIAPDVSLIVSQNAIETTNVAQDGGNVTVVASVLDPNVDDTVQLEWSSTLTNIGDASQATEFVIDPRGLSEGVYAVSVTATDAQGATDTASVSLVVSVSLPTLSDQIDTDDDGIDDVTEGSGDSDQDGIPNFLDNIPASNILPQSALETDTFLLESNPGVTIRLGEFALQGSTGGARLEEIDVDTLDGLMDDADFDLSGGIFDFEVVDLPQQGQTVQIVIPQITAIPANAVYRKFQNGEWSTFVEDENNSLSSTPGELGFCPPPGDSSWEAGLVEGHLCVQLTIEDGGPNDADGEANSAVIDPGSVGVQATRVSNSGGGGGAIGWLLLSLLSFLVMRGKKRVRW